MLIIVVFLTALGQAAQTQQYGHYCGLGHTNTFGIEPVDALDRLCQIHDICVTAGGYLNCFCNEQLYARMSMLTLTTDSQNLNGILI